MRMPDRISGAKGTSVSAHGEIWGDFPEGPAKMSVRLVLLREDNGIVYDLEFVDRYVRLADKEGDLKGETK